MIIGNRSIFAIESGITQAYSRPSLMALGFFVIYIRGSCYGVREPDATMLACSFGAVKDMIATKPTQITGISDSAPAGEVADAFRVAVYGASPPSQATISVSEIFKENKFNFVWAPDGDAAFDDGSYVLQFDIDERVRLIAFRCLPNGLHDPESIKEIWLDSKDFYSVLEDWQDKFHAEWKQLPKSN